MDNGNPPTWKKQSWTTFFYGMCTEDRMTETIKQAEEDGCELVQVMAGMIPAPQSAVMLPGAKQGPIPVLRILVRTLDSNYDALIAKRDVGAGKGVH